MTEKVNCPGWLDDAARGEWRRLVMAAGDDSRDPEVLAAYCLTASLWRIAYEIIEAAMRDHGGAGRGEREHPLAGLEAALASELTALAETLDIAPVDGRTRRPTRILILDEGPEDDPE
jgi:phage terminase small subunit